MSGKANSKWIYGSTDEGAYVACSFCNRKLSAKQVMFADKPFDVCPYCNRRMSEVDDDIIERLRVSLL